MILPSLGFADPVNAGLRPDGRRLRGARPPQEQGVQLGLQLEGRGAALPVRRWRRRGLGGGRFRAGLQG